MNVASVRKPSANRLGFDSASFSDVAENQECLGTLLQGNSNGICDPLLCNWRNEADVYSEQRAIRVITDRGSAALETFAKNRPPG